MLWVYHFQTVKQLVQRAYIAVIVLSDFACTEQLHNHREILLVWRCFVFRIKYQARSSILAAVSQNGSCDCEPFGVVALNKICYQPLNIVVVPEIDKRVVTMAPVHIDKVKHTHLIAFIFQQTPDVTDDFTLWVKHHKKRCCIA